MSIIGFTFAANRVLAFGFACVFGLAIWLFLTRTRFGAAMRALAIEPTGARLVGVDATAMSALAFACGGALVAVAGTMVSTFLTFNPAIGVEFTMKALVVVMMGGVGNMVGSLVAGVLLGVAEVALLLPAGFRPDAGGRLFPVPDRAAGPAARTVRDPVSMRVSFAVIALALLVAALAAVPWLVSDYGLGFMINLMCYLVLTVAWALFSGTTRYVSLATAAFFGVGAYTRGDAGQGDADLRHASASRWTVGTLMALLVGLVTLRISGMFFVIFGFGLSELMRELLVWWEINQTHTMGRYVFVPFDNMLIYEHLLALAVLVFLVGWLLRQIASRGRAAGDRRRRDHGASGRHQRAAGQGDDIRRLVGVHDAGGAVMAPRFGYLTPEFRVQSADLVQVVIMALLGGMQRLWGPVLGVVPLILLSELVAGAVSILVQRAARPGVHGDRLFSSARDDRAGGGWLGGAAPADRRCRAGSPDRCVDCWAWLSRPMSVPRGIAGAGRGCLVADDPPPAGRGR